jgi:class 3 adenylate cyclase
MIPAPGQPAARPPEGQLCAMFGCDIAGFTRPSRDEEIQLHLRHALYDMLRDAFTVSGVPWDRAGYHDRGDGALIIAPPGTSAQAMIEPLPGRLAGLVRRHNRIVTEPARIQLRAAVHAGTVYHDEQGILGDDVNRLCRMLESGELRRILATSGADLALIVSAGVYDSLIRRHPSLVDPASFRPLTTTVKGMRMHTRVRLFGVQPPQPRDPPA